MKILSENEQHDTTVKTVAIILLVVGIGGAVYFGFNYIQKPVESTPSDSFFVDERVVEIHGKIEKMMKNYTLNPRPFAEKVSEHCYLQILEGMKIRTACTSPLVDDEKKIIQDYFNKHPIGSGPLV